MGAVELPGSWNDFPKIDARYIQAKHFCHSCGLLEMLKDLVLTKGVKIDKEVKRRAASSAEGRVPLDYYLHRLHEVLVDEYIETDGKSKSNYALLMESRGGDAATVDISLTTFKLMAEEKIIPSPTGAFI